ncbi:GNAT family N-acetyltransferase [Streptomyces sp. NPDC102394]|uniref:GNAT family N-acetyltransferase n=1 Tax=Streptomyces sp. NPDC102394 TaxID=3366167 RepID=UPI00380A8C4F
MKIQVEAAREADQELVDALGRLLPQLSRSARPLDAPALARVLACDTNRTTVSLLSGLLMEQALEPAREAGARAVDLTSRPDREAVNRLYERLGFQRRGSTVYRYPIEE